MNKIFSMLGAAVKTLSTKVQAHPKTSAVEVLLMELVGERCQLEFERQDEVFEGVLRSSFGDLTWECDATFEAHWLNAIGINDDGSYTIYVRVPDDEYAEMAEEFEEEQGEISFLRGSVCQLPSEGNP